MNLFGRFHLQKKNLSLTVDSAGEKFYVDSVDVRFYPDSDLILSIAVGNNTRH